jgi:hypothetical protein
MFREPFEQIERSGQAETIRMRSSIPTVLSIRRVLRKPSFLPPSKLASLSFCCALRGEPRKTRSPQAPGDVRLEDAFASA